MTLTKWILNRQILKTQTTQARNLHTFERPTLHHILGYNQVGHSNVGRPVS